MFRECYFEYAGISSQLYNLIFCYIQDTNDSFDSGGKFALQTETIPCSYETLLYEKNYSEEPLSFSVEIVNHEEAIPLEQMISIKNWLFGQDGWKTLRLIDGQQSYYLKCIFEPGEDIVDGTGYRGVRCTLHNVSPFWYGEEKEISISNSQILDNTITVTTVVEVGGEEESTTTSYSAADIYIPEEEMEGLQLSPICVLELTATTVTEDEDTTVSISNTNATSIEQTLQHNDGVFVFPDTTYTAFELDTTISDVVTIDTKYAIMNAQTQTIGWHNPNAFASLPIFRLSKGHNYIRMTTSGGYLSGLKIRYTPIYRLGAF